MIPLIVILSLSLYIVENTTNLCINVLLPYKGMIQWESLISIPEIKMNNTDWFVHYEQSLCKSVYSPSISYFICWEKNEVQSCQFSVNYSWQVNGITLLNDANEMSSCQSVAAVGVHISFLPLRIINSHTSHDLKADASGRKFLVTLDRENGQTSLKFGIRTNQHRASVAF